MAEKQEFHTVRGYQMLEQDRNVLTSAMEDYMEMIYRNSLNTGYVRISAVSGLLNVKASSVTKMVQKLAVIGLIQYERYGIIMLTEKGKEIGKFLLERHEIIEKFLKNIGVENNLLVETELMEHNVSIDTLKRLEFINKYFKVKPQVKADFLKFSNEK
ncbi:MAG: metal-dependent transcriptional regulator [Ignavibacteriales bacterium]